MCDRELLGFDSLMRPEGAYELTCSDRREFGPGEFLLNGLSVAVVHIKVDSTVRVAHPQVVKCYDVEGRGRVVSLERVSLTDSISVGVDVIGLV